jgi:hypothetical protein
MIVVLGAGVAGLFALGLEHTQLKRRLARQGEWRQMTQRLEEENRQLGALAARGGAEDAGAREAVHADLVRARREVAELEQSARLRRTELRAVAAQDENALANNRDPQRGLTRLEYFTDAGQASPAAAFQTLGWAVVKEPERIASLLTLAPEARAKAEALIAGLPEAARAQWTPEKLGELFLTGALTSASAIQISDVKMEGADRATLTFRIPGARGDPKLAMILGVDGWRVLVEGRGIDVVRKQIDQTGR